MKFWLPLLFLPLLLVVGWVGATEARIALAQRQLQGGGCKAWQVLAPAKLIRPYEGDQQGELQRPAQALLKALGQTPPDWPYVRVSQEVGGNYPYDAISVRTAWLHDGHWTVQAVSASFTWRDYVPGEPQGFNLGAPKVNPPEPLPAAEAAKLEALLAQTCQPAEPSYIGGLGLRVEQNAWRPFHRFIYSMDTPSAARLVEIKWAGGQWLFYQVSPVGRTGAIGEIISRFGGETASAPLG